MANDAPMPLFVLQDVQTIVGDGSISDVPDLPDLLDMATVNVDASVSVDQGALVWPNQSTLVYRHGGINIHRRHIE